MVGGQRIGIHERCEYEVLGDQQHYRYPSELARSACPEEQQRSRYGSKCVGVGKKSECDSKDNKQKSQHWDTSEGQSRILRLRRAVSQVGRNRTVPHFASRAPPPFGGWRV